MATLVPLYETATLEHESFKVRLPLLSLADHSQREVWCRDSTRPGIYSVRVNGLHGYTQFNFSDENVAFEFKMRWA